MIRTVLYPVETRSLNVSFRGAAMDPASAQKVAFAKLGATKRERKATARALEDPRFGPPPDVEAIRAGLHVDLVRVAVGTLDYPANLGGALKSVQDEVARWIKLSDRDSRISWDFLQAKCERAPLIPGAPSYQGVRVRVRCSTPGPDVDIVCGIGPARIGPESHDGGGELPRSEHGKSARKDAERRAIAAVSPVRPAPRPPAPPRAQLPLGMHWPAYALDPWLQTGDGLPELSELELLVEGSAPPPAIRRKVPPMVRGMNAHARNAVLRLSKRRVELYRHEVEHPALDGRAWIYAERGAAELAYFDREDAAE